MAKARVFRGDPEQKQVALFDNFLGGINTTEIDEQTRTNEFRELENVELIEEGRIQKRMGWSNVKELNRAVFDNYAFNNIYYFGIIKDEKNVLHRLDTVQGTYELSIDMIVQDVEVSTRLYKVIKYIALKVTRDQQDNISVEELHNEVIYSEVNNQAFEVKPPKINQIEILNYSGRKYFLLNQIVKDSEDIVEFYINDNNKFIINLFNKNNSYTPNAYEAKNVGYNILKGNPLEIHSDNLGAGGITSVLITDYVIANEPISKNIYNNIVNTERFAIRILFAGKDEFFEGMEVKMYYLSGENKKYITAKIDSLPIVDGWKFYNISEIKALPENEEIVFEFIKAGNDTTIEHFDSVEDIFDEYYNKKIVSPTIEQKKAYLKKIENTGRYNLLIAHDTDPFRYSDIIIDGGSSHNGIYAGVFDKPYTYYNTSTVNGIMYNDGPPAYSGQIPVLDIQTLKVKHAFHISNYLRNSTEYAHETIGEIVNLPSGQTLDYDFDLTAEAIGFPNPVGISPEELSYMGFPEGLFTEEDAVPISPPYTSAKFEAWLNSSGVLDRFTADNLKNRTYPAIKVKLAWQNQGGNPSGDSELSYTYYGTNTPPGSGFILNTFTDPQGKACTPEGGRASYFDENTGVTRYYVCSPSTNQDWSTTDVEFSYIIRQRPSDENRKGLFLKNYLNYTLETDEFFKVGDKYYTYNGTTVEYTGSNKDAYFTETQRPDIIYEYLAPFEVKNSEPIEIIPANFKNVKGIIFDDRLVLYGGNTIIYSDVFSTAKNNIEQSFSYFPNYNTITLNLSSNDEIQKIAYYRGSHVIFTKECIYRLGGVLNTESMEVVMINDTIGCISADSVRSLNNTVVFLTVDGLYSLRQNYYQEGLENVIKIDTKIKGVIPYGTNYESMIVNEQYLLHIKDVEGNYIKTLKQYYNMVNSSRELPYTIDIYRETPNTAFKVMGNMFGFYKNQLYIFGKGFTDFMDKDIIPDIKDEYAYPIKILTANWDLSHPIHEKKFKNLFIKLSSSSIVGIYFKIKVDKSVTTDSTQYLVEMNSRGELEYKIIRDPNINTFHTALVSSTNMTLGAGVLGQSYLGDVRYQVHKVAPAVKGRVIQLYFENNTADRLAIDSISLVYKLGKMRESV